MLYQSGVVTLDIMDWAIFLIYFILFFLAAVIYRRSKLHLEDYKRFFLPAFIVKVLGGMMFALVFIYFYGFGDTFLYFKGSTVLSYTISHDTATWLRLMTSENGNLPPDLSIYADIIPYSRTKEEWFMVKLISPINFISFRSYLVMTLCCSMVSFYGSWKLFRVFTDFFPERKKLSFLITFLLPSTLFWGSGILKDTFSMAAINIIIHATYFMIFKSHYTFRNWVYLIAGVLLLLQLKLYILLSFLPAMAFGVYYNIRNRIKSPVINFVMRPTLFIVLAVVSYLITINLGKVNEKYAVNSLEKQARGFHTWHVTTAGSAYTLGEIDYTPIGVVKKIPPALNVTFFRPYLWESQNPIMLIGALESMLLLILVLYTLWLWGYKIFMAIGRDPLIVTLLIFVLIFGFAVGFTSYNFGALARYKIPISSLTFFIFFYLIDVKRKIDAKKLGKIL